MTSDDPKRSSDVLVDFFLVFFFLALSSTTQNVLCDQELLLTWFSSTRHALGAVFLQFKMKGIMNSSKKHKSFRHRFKKKNQLTNIALITGRNTFEMMYPGLINF